MWSLLFFVIKNLIIDIQGGYYLQFVTHATYIRHLSRHIFMYVYHTYIHTYTNMHIDSMEKLVQLVRYKNDIL